MGSSSSSSFSYARLRVFYDTPSDELEIKLRTLGLESRCRDLRGMIEDKKYYEASRRYNVVYLHSGLWSWVFNSAAIQAQRNKAQELDELYLCARNEFLHGVPVDWHSEY